MGAAVISETSLFRARDFSPRRRIPGAGQGGFAGYFASLEEVNRYLLRRRSQGRRENLRRAKVLIVSTF